MSDKKWIRMGGLWIKETRIGKIASGSFGTASLILVKNDKRHDRDPDYILYVAEKTERQKEDAEGQAVIDEQHDRRSEEGPF